MTGMARGFRMDSHLGYEYRERLVSDSMAPLYADNYPCFGWQLDSQHRALGGVGRVLMRFRREQKLVNRVELTRLQRQFDADVKVIEAMESSKLVTASMAAYTVGILGCAFVGGSVFAFLAGWVVLGVVLAVPGFAGWAAAYLCYRAIGRKKAAQMQPFIQQKYEDIYAVCEKAHALHL